MTVRVGINGFGRIGRNFFRAAKASGADIDFVAVNDLGSLDIMAGLPQSDSVHGRYPGTVSVTDDGVVLLDLFDGDRPGWGRVSLLEDVSVYRPDRDDAMVAA